MPPCCSTSSRTASPSQSSRISRTRCTYPEVTALRHNCPRAPDHQPARPSAAVAASASRFIHASVNTLPVAASWAIAGTSPSAFHCTASSQASVMALFDLNAAESTKTPARRPAHAERGTGRIGDGRDSPYHAPPDRCPRPLDTFEPHTFGARDGYPLAGRLFRPPDRTVAAALIVPAMGVAQPYYAAFAGWLARQGVLAATFDYRGIGLSRRGSLRDLDANVLTWARLDVPAALDALAQAAAGAPLVWIGHS